MIAPVSRRLLVLRAGLAGLPPLSANQVARVLHVSGSTEAVLEGLALTQLQSAARGGCPAAPPGVVMLLAGYLPTYSASSLEGSALPVSAGTVTSSFLTRISSSGVRPGRLSPLPPITHSSLPYSFPAPAETTSIQSKSLSGGVIAAMAAVALAIAALLLYIRRRTATVSAVSAAGVATTHSAPSEFQASPAQPRPEEAPAVPTPASAEPVPDELLANAPARPEALERPSWLRAHKTGVAVVATLLAGAIRLLAGAHRSRGRRR